MTKSGSTPGTDERTAWCDGGSGAAPAWRAVLRRPFLWEALLDAPLRRASPTPTTPCLVRLMVSFLHLPCKDRVASRGRRLVGVGHVGVTPRVM